jgi:hypothetical protein
MNEASFFAGHGWRTPFSGPVIVFHEHPLPERATPAGYAALIDAFALRVPLPRIEGLVDMPDRTIDFLFRFLHQNDGTLSKRTRAEEFAGLTEAEVSAAVTAYRELFLPAA